MFKIQSCQCKRVLSRNFILVIAEIISYKLYYILQQSWTKKLTKEGSPNASRKKIKNINSFRKSSVIKPSNMNKQIVSKSSRIKAKEKS